MSVEDEIQILLRESGARLLRQGVHRVYELPNGKRFVMAASPSDRRAADNSLSDLRKALGLKREVHKNPERRAERREHSKPRPNGSVKIFSLSPSPALSSNSASASSRAPSALKPDPFAGWQFPTNRLKRYQDCCPIRLQPIPMTPFWCLLRCLFGYGGKAQASIAEETVSGFH